MPDYDEAPHPAENDNVTSIDQGRRRGRKRKEVPAAGELTELDVSERFLERFADDLIYVDALGGWHVWVGTHFALDALGKTQEMVKELARELAADAATSMDGELFRVAKRTGSARGVVAVLSLARTDPRVARRPEDLNSNPHLLNCLGGTVDLRDGQCRPHDRADLITKVAPVEYDPVATSPTFERFLAEVQQDPEVRAYLARLFGYAAIGGVWEHALAVLWGVGANGKSVLADTVTHVLGDYAGPGPSSLIVANSRHEPHPTDVASLAGRRLVLVHETKRGASFDASKVKLLTGGDQLTARHMREDFFSFAPTHTLVMLSNYRPSADASDAALWRRVHLVPFEVVIPEDDRDPRLAEKIRAEAPGVLRWIVEGALQWQRDGLAPPKAIREQTERYRTSEDVVGQFLDECTVKLSQASVRASRLYEAYRAWCESNGHRPVRGNDFASEVSGRGFDKRKTRSGMVYEGVGLHAQDSEGDR